MFNNKKMWTNALETQIFVVTSAPTLLGRTTAAVTLDINWMKMDTNVMVSETVFT